ncbi:hypothetical protein [Intestinibacter bartlettii]|uniref:Alternate signal-mediated exported protein, CPF_0494 family n=1 Tax=Intestinibacter bartlettii TaxID=261299 RepID=A0ABS6DY48_9FIRM|nr:hypothetical protein [Intestinibacter bartlettii]MBU5336771.1 hypothetical protein [Intestinibacter bartlettii]MDO5010579.1 hypothetical protein [Intestinibacter bartlettii]
MKKRRKLLIALLAVILVPGAIGFGFNFFSWNSNKEVSKQTMTVDGEINVSPVSEGASLLPGDKICDKVEFDIKSTATSLLRVKIVPYISDTVSGDKQSADVCKIENSENSKWIDGKDGYYYYSEGVSKANGTIPFDNKIYFDIPEGGESNDYQGKYIHANVQAEMVQAKHGVFEQQWGVGSGHAAYAKLKAISNAQGE